MTNWQPCSFPIHSLPPFTVCFSNGGLVTAQQKVFYDEPNKRMDEWMVRRWDVDLGGDWRGGGGSTGGRCDCKAVQEIVVMAKDTICGMTVNESTALQAEREGVRFYFYSENCQKQFLSAPSIAKQEER